MGRLDGKVAFISGGANSLGAANASLFAAEGARVIIADVLETEGKNLAKSLGPRGTFVFLDVTDPSGWIRAAEIAENAYGPVNILVNNAGRVNHVPFDECTNQQFGEIIEANLYGTFYGIKTIIPSMQKAGSGTIINISSVSGLRGYPMMPGCVTAHWGVRGLTKSAALDLARYHIRVNSVHSGEVLTPATKSGDIETGHVAMNRPATPDEIARVVVFLATDESSFITGAEIAVDGGESAGLANCR
ncbi:short-chain dehydrogenase/reductase SDR [Methanoregula boonei 6A8]|jgi:3alpha(or 20beta)-hydroxysteroid dehydrogenase|uniref:Short-chain dehydrogenase/reductase SDR n=1 Tax=Methanoregula boonei (strain DSM 21154 / JCM 14090 / 6A8) TaxID=456442 RepID=A7I5B4_METB6|nr:SDR family oxidoreductase [Methanoregula boonei]ABS54925.1 short-chain dehydrogenase/reductase SDR [Methanoregula boonei 6A8]